MGGFRFNGCGVADHFKVIKSLGTHICPSCKKPTEFTLDEANQKIDILWIPTFTLKSRYAVMCKKCKTGEFCSAEWAGYLLNQSGSPEVFLESEAKKKGWSVETQSFSGTVPAIQQTAAPPLPEKVNPVKQPVSSNTQLTCPSCGNIQEVGNKFCSKCGQKLTAAASRVKFCSGCGAKITDGMLFCSECGRKVAD